MICSICGTKHDRIGQRYCCDCHAAYMREWRKTHDLNAVQRQKDIARSYAGVYKRRGKLVPQPCWCGAPAEMHHGDYTHPIDVKWLCREHHLALHCSMLNVKQIEGRL